MDSTHQNAVRRVTREELHTLVWSKPMSRLAQEFGVSGNGLAKICDRLDVPYPPRGYWAKKAARKPAPALKLPSWKAGLPQSADIHRTPPRPETPSVIVEARAAVGGKIDGVSVPESLDALHPRVKAWLSEHKNEQKSREQDSRRHKHEGWWTHRLLPDLTDRDLYRFRVTSAIFKGVEKAGGRIETAPLSGRVTFEASGQKVECSIVEKLIRSLKLREEASKWTAYPDHHQSGLTSSGFLRVSITTYLDGRQPQWIETEKVKIGDLLPEIVGAIIAAGPMLVQRQREREENEKRYREEERRRYEARRLKELDDKRWNAFREIASDWEERQKLLAFLAEIKTLASREGDAMIGDVSLLDWIAWADKRIEALDPFKQGAKGLFEAVARVPHWP